MPRVWAWLTQWLPTPRSSRWLGSPLVTTRGGPFVLAHTRQGFWRSASNIHGRSASNIHRPSSIFKLKPLFRRLGTPTMAARWGHGITCERGGVNAQEIDDVYRAERRR